VVQLGYDGMEILMRNSRTAGNKSSPRY